MSFFKTAAPRLLAALFLAVSFYWFTRANDFPSRYHIDEQTKVEQVFFDYRNLRHPPLLLDTTGAFLFLSGWPHDLRHAAISGRTVSAFCAAAAVAGLVFLAATEWGLLAGLLTGFFTAGYHQTFQLAHFMKEDTAFLMSLVLSFLALAQFLKRRDLFTLILLGVACGFSCGTKYAGAITLFWSLPALLGAPGKWKRLGLFFCAAGLVAGLVNLQLFLNIGWLGIVFSEEIRNLAQGHDGLARSVPHLYYFEALQRMIALPVRILAGFWLIATLLRWREGPRWIWAPLLFSLLFPVALSFSPKTSETYLFPAAVLFHFFAALGLASLAQHSPIPMPAPFQQWIPAVVALVIFCVTAWPLALRAKENFQSFHEDQHTALAKWIRASLPVDAILAQDRRVALPDRDTAWTCRPDELLSQRIVTGDYVPNLGSLEELRLAGFSHVAVAKPDYHRFVETGFKPGAAQSAEFEHHRGFYLALFSEGTLLWESDPGENMHLQPGLRLYRIKQEAVPDAAHPTR